MLLSAKQTDPRNLISKVPWDRSAAALLLGAVAFAGGRLVATQWTDHLFSVQLLGLLACLFGLFIGRSRLPGWLGAFYGFLYGAFFVPWQLSLMITGHQSWDERLRLLTQRITATMGQVLAGVAADDAILFLVGISAVFWAFGLVAGYRLSRQGDAWGAILPFGLLAVAYQTYDPSISSRAWYLAIFMLFALLLVARYHLIKQEKTWEQNRVLEPQGIRNEVQRFGLQAIPLLILLAWALPSLVSSLDSAEHFWKTLTSPWHSLESGLEHAFNPLKGTQIVSSEPFGDRLQLGSGNSRSDAVAFVVQPTSERNALGLRYYWRDRVYDHYENGGWQDTLADQSQIDAGQPSNWATEVAGRVQVVFQFTIQEPGPLLHAAPQPVIFDKTVTASFVQNPDGSMDLYSVNGGQLKRGESYVEESWLSVATASQLQASNRKYPDWVTERYLQVPPEITERTRQLAFQLAAGKQTPYEIATAITTYLRQNIHYREILPALPNGAEPIDWMLFEQKEAFCNYYATAEVILLRVLGVPARLAAGYSQGERHTLQDGALEYIVRNRNAHAWPEVYFPNFGWVEFEPTAIQEVLVRPGQITAALTLEELGREHPTAGQDRNGAPLTDLAEPDVNNNSEQDSRFSLSHTERINALFIGVVSALIAAAIWFRTRNNRAPIVVPILVSRTLAKFDLNTPRSVTRWVQRARLSPVDQTYWEVNAALHRLGFVPKPGETPSQRAKLLGQSVPKLKEEISRFGLEYENYLYGSKTSLPHVSGRELLQKIKIASVKSRFDQWFRSTWLKMISKGSS